MTIKDITTIITTVALTLACFTFMGLKIEQGASMREAELERAAVSGRLWMQETTAKLDSIQVGIEYITGETNILAKQVEEFSDRLDRAEL